MSYSDELLRGVLSRTRKVAIVGLSLKETRASYFVGRYMKMRGYEIYPVNPAYVGRDFMGAPFVAGLADLPDDVDMLDLFRRSEDVLPVVQEALEVMPALKAVWMQLGVVNDAAAELAAARGVDVIMDRCPKIEHQRLFGELRKGGFNTGVISSKL